MLLSDLSGRIILQEERRCKAGLNTMQVEQLAQLPPGTYVLHINYAGGQWQQKIIKAQ